ncbi:hypothetical protein BDV96DRAFT_647169 [Lophiotrema nucula]|uniref:DUF7730 domain-containing protein n=1 Tax=Lophiotrema nucula TaxID=690887 RepID=A0A6A5Z537_9PLEO|nr:hypothetical protein BDV96DRAFT_647169 [Lophiotrema nucula]
MTVFCPRPVTETDDKLLSLLLTCRLIYSETYAVLYQRNIFHFRGTPALLAFRSSISMKQWQLIRHVHLSTLYTGDSRWVTQEKYWPPEDPLNWEQCSKLLHQLPNLDSLKLEMIVRWDSWEAVNTSPARKPDRILMAALEPLKTITAKVFIIELDMEPSESVWDYLGPVNFVTVIRERKWNLDVYRKNPSHIITL